MKNSTKVLKIHPHVSYNDKKGWLKVNLKSIQPTGANTILQVEYRNNFITLLQPEFIRMDLNEPLWINFDSSNINYFNDETGRNIFV